MSLLNRAQVRRMALEVARQTGRPFTRVSAEFFEELERVLRTAVAARVHAAKGGKTL